MHFCKNKDKAMEFAQLKKKYKIWKNNEKQNKYYLKILFHLIIIKYNDFKKYPFFKIQIIFLKLDLII